jgi:hypothetical protein
MSIAARLIALAFIAIGVFLMSGEASWDDRRHGLGALAFGLSVWTVHYALRVQAFDFRQGETRRARTGRQEFRMPRASVGLMTLGTLLFAAAPPLATQGASVFGFVLAAPVALAFLWLAHWAVDPRPVVRVDPQGLYDRRIMRQPIPWKAVSKIVAENHGPIEALVLFCKDPKPYARRGPLVAWGRRPDGFIISAMLLDGRREELAEAIYQNRPRPSRARVKPSGDMA